MESATEGKQDKQDDTVLQPKPQRAGSTFSVAPVFSRVTAQRPLCFG